MYTILNGLRSGMYTVLNGECPGRAGRCSKEVALPAMRSKGAGGGEPAAGSKSLLESTSTGCAEHSEPSRPRPALDRF